MDLPLALSVHRFVTSVGAYAGFAAIIGLAILVLLFFAQARETNALRDHVDELLDRIGGLESRLSRQAAQAAQNAAEQQAAAAPAAAGAQSPSAASELAALELAPFPPAGVAAPALSAATRVVPAGVMVGASATRSAVAVGNGPRPTTASPALAGANGSSRPGAPAPVAAGPIGADAAHRSAPSSTRPATAAAGARPVNSAARRPPARPAAPVRQDRGRRVPVLLIGLIVAAVVIVGAVVAGIALSSSGSHKAARTASTTRSASASASRLAAVNPHTVTVAVLNGTATAGLAHRTAQRLAGEGFQEGKIMTASDQTRTSTTVAYIPGARPQAVAVAKALNLGAASVAPVDAGTREVACQGLPTCTASVFVTVGADLAKQ